MQPQKELSISATAAHTTAGVTRTYGGMSNSDSARTKLATADEKIDGEPLDASLSPSPTRENTERGAAHREQERGIANITTPRGSISRGIFGGFCIRASTPDDTKFTPCPPNSPVALSTHRRQISVESRLSNQSGDGNEESGSSTTKATSHDGELSPHIEDQQTWEFFIGLGGSVPDSYKQS